MKILITGCGGQLGSDCITVLRGGHELIPLTSRELDITDLKKVEQVIQRVRPAYILNCAAFTNVDACESQRETAWNVNVEGPRNLALVTEQYRIHLAHISTDYVFDGRRRSLEGYRESDETAPQSYYGETKVAGERAIREITDRYMVVRTAWMYGVHGRNFPGTMLRLAYNDPEREIKVVNDQYGSPTWSLTLAMQLERLIIAGGQGIYHATAEGYGTWYECARYFLEKIDVPHRLVPCSSADYPTPARRPRNSILENDRLKAERITVMNDWRQDMDRYVERYRQRLLSEAREIKIFEGKATDRENPRL